MDSPVNYQTKFLGPLHSWDYAALVIYCQVELCELLRASPNQLLSS